MSKRTNEKIRLDAKKGSFMNDKSEGVAAAKRSEHGGKQNNSDLGSK